MPKHSTIPEIIGTQLESAKRDEVSHIWRFLFESGHKISIESLWRITGEANVLLTGEDHMQQFGLPKPVDAQSEAEKLLHGKVTEATIGPFGDVVIRFQGGNQLEVYVTSSGYEAWTFEGEKRLLVAQGGGAIAEFKSQS